MSRYIIVEKGDYDHTVLHECVVDSALDAIKAFRTLYGEQNGYLLYQQVAVSEPAGSRDEADDSCGQVGVLKDFAGLS